jgi:hypothetical protein
MRGRAASRGGASRERGRAEEEGKADGWVPPVSCPGWKGDVASRHVAMVGWAARVRGRKGKEESGWAWAGGAGPVRARKRERKKGAAGPGVVLAGGLVVH